MGWLSDALKFEKSKISDMWSGIKKDPKRMVLGVDPLSTGAWNAVLGRNDQPIVGDFGGPTQQNYENAEARGINTGSARTLNGIAKAVASIYGGQAVGGALGGGGGEGSNLAQYAQLGQQAAGAMQPQPVPSFSPPPMNAPRTAQARPVMQTMGAGPGPVMTGNAEQRRRMAMAQALRGRGMF